MRREYYKEKNFLKKLAETFGITEQGSRAGVITFSHKAIHSIKLKDFKTFKTFNRAVDAIPLMGYTTRIDSALRMALDELYLAENGGRENLPKILFLLTDGFQTKDVGAENSTVLGNVLRDRGVVVLSVGIGPRTNYEELKAIAGGERNAFMARTFDSLLGIDFVKTLAERACEAGLCLRFYIF